MKILYVHNEYAKPSGEEQAAAELVALLREHGHEVKWFTRSSAEIAGSIAGEVKGLFAGIYNPSAARKLGRMLDEYKPDIVQVQNIYPLLSSAIFKPMKRRGIPVVMRCPNYRLFCPNGLCLDSHGQVCERCWGGKEINCIRQNCLGNKGRSIGYAARNAFGRMTKQIIDGVDVLIVQSEFQKHKFMGEGIPEEKIGILPGISPVIAEAKEPGRNEYVSFVGRVSPEKGIYEFIEAARMNPDIPHKVAGHLDAKFRMPEDVPANLEFVGFKQGEELDRFYEDSRIVVVPSKWYEGFPNVIVRGMMHRKPVVTTDIGAMTSIIDDGKSGMLVTPADAGALAAAIRKLYPDKERCGEMGETGWKKANTEYAREAVYNMLLAIYLQARYNMKQER